MKQTLPWSVTGIPPEVREAARTAAMREGVSVGDWLARRIVQQNAGSASASLDGPDSLQPRERDSIREREAAREREQESLRDRDTLRDRDDLAMRLARTEVEADSALKRIDDAVRAMSRRLETTERSNTEVHRAVSSATSEISAATRDQAQAFSLLTQRIEQLERHNDTGALREAVRGLHQGLSRLADQNAHMASETTNQVTALAASLESLAAQTERARDEAGELEGFIHDRFASLSDRLHQTEERAASGGHVLERMAELDARVKSSEKRAEENIGRDGGLSEKLEKTATAFEARIVASEDQMRGALARQAQSATKLEDLIAALDSRLKASEEQLKSGISRQVATGGKLDESLSGLDARLKASEDQLKAVLARQLSTGAKIEDSLSGIDARLKASEEQLRNVLSRSSGGNVQDTIAALDARMKASEEQVKTALSRQAQSGSKVEEAMNALDTRVRTSEERLQEAFARHLASIERNLENIAERIEHAERRGETENSLQDALRAISQRLDTSDKKSRDSLTELKTTLTDAARRIESVEMVQNALTKQMQQTSAALAAQPMALTNPLPPVPVIQAQPMQPPPLAIQLTTPMGDSTPFDLPPLADAPPFPAGGFAPPRPGEEFTSQLAPESADVFPARPELVPHAAQDYLTQARRAAQAAADPAANRNVRGQLGGFTDAAGAEAAERKGWKMSRPIAAVIIGIIVIGAGLMLARILSTHTEVSATPDNSQVGLNTAAPAPAPVAPAPALPAPQENNNRTASAIPATLPANAGHASRTPVSLTQAAPAGSSMDRLAARANQGDVKAALLLGLRYADGDGVQASDRDALRWLQKAADAGEPVAQYRLGTLYEKGRGVPADAKQAATWYTKAAERGNRKAMHNLAVVYADGNGSEKNFAEAAHWFKAAADLGLTDSQFNLAVLYERGLGVPASLTEAYKWYSIAAAAGDSESKTRVETLITQLQPAERNAAEQAIRTFKIQPLDPASNEPPALAQVIQ